MSDQIYKLPPQCQNEEQAVLGAILIEKNAILKVLNLNINEKSFYAEKNRVVFNICHDLYRKNEEIDLLTVTNALRKIKKLDFVGGPAYLVELTSWVSSAENISAHVLLIKEKFALRKIIEFASKLIDSAYDVSAHAIEVNESFQSYAIESTQNLFINQKKTSKQLVHEALSEIEIAKDKRANNELSGVSSGLKDIDGLTGGWQKNDLIILAARPSMGKTAASLHFAKSCLKNKGVVLVFSLEMSGTQNIKRLLSTTSKVEYSRMAKGEINNTEFQRIQETLGDIYSDDLIIDDSSSISVIDIRATSMTTKIERGKLDLIVVDYLQLVKGVSKGNREQEIASISRGLKILAKTLQVPIIALSQLSRSVETRGGDKRPQLSDLRESGAIEQDADTVIFLYRPEYYGIDVDEDNNSTKGVIEFNFAKHRNGACIPIRTIGNMPTNEFFDYGTIVETENYIPDRRFDVLDMPRNSELLEGYLVNYDSGDVNKTNNTPF